MKHLLNLTELSSGEILEILNLADQLKYEQQHGIPHPLLAGKTVGIFLTEPRPQIRLSFEAGVVQLGGYPLILGPSDLGQGIGEWGKEAARYLDAAVVCASSQEAAAELAGQGGEIAVVSAGADASDPCGALAALMSIREQKGSFSALKLAVAGEGDMDHAAVLGCIKMGMTVVQEGADLLSTDGIFDPGENRLHLQKAVLVKLLQP